jgi:pyruvate/2-oxoglutarate dehydrogenase complex dihydrolipoamide dehydrogenase (E3) component
MPDFDIAVIGAGAAGLSVAAGASQLGRRVVLIERERMGGDCLNTGCVPSKALLAAARACRVIRSAPRFGVTAGEPVVSWDAVRAHVHGVIEEIAPVDSAARYQGLGVTVLNGQARFADPGTLIVDGRRITARRIVIAAGSRAVVPPVPGLASKPATVPYWTNESLFDLTVRPDHLLILGGGPIGLEMADAFSGLGCQVTVIEAGHISAREDAELADGLRMALTTGGVTILEHATVTQVTPGPVVVLADGRRIAGSHLLVATGRRPNIEDLDLAAGNVRAGPGGIATDAGLRSLTNRLVFAVGDIADPAGTGPRAFTHVAGYHAGIVIRRMLFRLPAHVDYAALPRVTYTDPELAQTGLTEAEAQAAGLQPRVLRWPLADNDRAVAERESGGLVKLVLSGKRLVGAGILAPHAGEMISLFSLAISRRIPVSALASLIVPYPTRSEAGKRAAGNFYMPKLFSDRTRWLVRVLSWLP